jgi:lysophospholipid acyltransferase (LPLAT)-like uncharacterized protein
VKIKIRRPWLLRAMGFAAAPLLQSWMGTLQFRYHPLGPDLWDTPQCLSQRYLYVTWHEYLLLPLYFLARTNTALLISQHADGQMVAELCHFLRLANVRGSTTRAGAKALRGLLQAAGRNHLALTPDGPRGPRREMKPGVVYLVAARAGLPIVPVGFGFDRPWRAASWDRLAVPRPWSLATCVSGTPLTIPANAGRAQLELYRRRAEADLLAVTQAAEAWAESGTHPAADRDERDVAAQAVLAFPGSRRAGSAAARRAA